jgi:hypothetical protein
MHLKTDERKREWETWCGREDADHKGQTVGGACDRNWRAHVDQQLGQPALQRVAEGRNGPAPKL